MADPVTIGMVVKTAVSTLSNEENRKTIGKVLTVVLAPLALVIAVICGMGDMSSAHNGKVLDACFSTFYLPFTVPEDYREHIGDMRNSFSILDGAIASFEADMEEGDSLDALRIKSIFMALFFGEESPSRRAHQDFVGCFVDEEERTRTVSGDDEDEEEETYTVYVPLTDDIRNLPTIYSRIAQVMGVDVTQDTQVNAAEIYFRIGGSGAVPDYGDSFGDWLAGVPVSDEPFIGTDGFCSPLGEHWRSMVTSPYGWRPNPTGPGKEFHTGIDLANSLGTPMRAALDGTVLLVRRSQGGYGLHLVIDHGGGFLTLYGHCNSISVAQGQTVTAGEVIATLGSTGRSTGPHLHFEIRNNGQTENPTKYLP